MKTERCYQFELRAGDYVVSGPIKKDPSQTKLVRAEKVPRDRAGFLVSRVAVIKGSRWIGYEGNHYHRGPAMIERVRSSGASTWVRFYLEGHGEEEITIEDFLKYYRPDQTREVSQ